MKYTLFTDTGDRKVNQDYISQSQKENSSLFILADGLGGHNSGEVASKLTVECCAEIHKDNDITGDQLLTKCFTEGQDKLMKEQEIRDVDMKTTLVLAEVTDGKLFSGHIGDSRLYVFRNKKVLYQTCDHSVPQMLVAMGEIKLKDIRNHPDRNKLLKVMGEDWDGKKKYQLADNPIQLQKGDALLLATDGFWELIDEKTMIKFHEKSKSCDEWMTLMANRVKRNGRHKNMDNYSAVGVVI